MNAYHEEDPPGKIYDAQLTRRLLGYLHPYRWTVATSIVFLSLVSILQLVGPYLTKVAIDRHISSGDVEGLSRIAMLFLLILVGQFLASYAQTYLMNWTGQKIMYDLRLQIFSHIQKLHVRYFDETPIGRVITRMTTDVDALNELFTAGVVSVFGDILSLTGIVVVMLWLNWKLALVCFSVIPLLFVATAIFKNRVRDSYRRVRSCVARINAFLQENITGMSVVQIFVQEKRKFGQFELRNREHLEANLQSILYYAVFYPVVNLIGALAIALILYYGGQQVLGEILTLGSLVAFIQYSERFYKPISDLSEKFNILQSAMASSERIFGLLDTKPQIVAPAKPRRLGNIEGRIEFENLSFAYRKGNPVLSDINLSVDAGERVAMVGATGSGKSTLINLLCRFYSGHSGEIRVDGVRIQDLDPGFLRDYIAVVLQDVFLFRGSIEDNIRLWGKPINREAVQEAARQVNAHQFIQALPQDYVTPVAERGVGLSVGQRQLLAFARALAQDPRILILDEATSSVDTDTELLIQEALNRLMRNRTCLIIAHRLSTIQTCDRIIVLHKGRITEQGTHQQLLQRRGIYYKLYQLQYKEQLVPEGLPGKKIRGRRAHG